MIQVPRIHARIIAFRAQKVLYIGDSTSKKIYIEGMSPVEHEWEPADTIFKGI